MAQSLFVEDVQRRAELARQRHRIAAGDGQVAVVVRGGGQGQDARQGKLSRGLAQGVWVPPTGLTALYGTEGRICQPRGHVIPSAARNLGTGATDRQRRDLSGGLGRPTPDPPPPPRRGKSN